MMSKKFTIKTYSPGMTLREYAAIHLKVPKRMEQKP